MEGAGIWIFNLVRDSPVCSRGSCEVSCIGGSWVNLRRVWLWGSSEETLEELGVPFVAGGHLLYRWEVLFLKVGEGFPCICP